MSQLLADLAVAPVIVKIAAVVMTVLTGFGVVLIAAVLHELIDAHIVDWRRHR